MDYCKINGVNYDVIVTDIQEDFTILFSENTGRVLDEGASMELDPLGTFFSHKVTFKRSQDNVEEFDKLYDFLATPRYTGFLIEIVHDQTTLKYEAYVSQGSRKIIKILQKLRKVFWGELAVSFVPIRAQVLPNQQGLVQDRYDIGYSDGYDAALESVGDFYDWEILTNSGSELTIGIYNYHATRYLHCSCIVVRSYDGVVLFRQEVVTFPDDSEFLVESLDYSNYELKVIISGVRWTENAEI